MRSHYVLFISIVFVCLSQFGCSEGSKPATADDQKKAEGSMSAMPPGMAGEGATPGGMQDMYRGGGGSPQGGPPGGQDPKKMYPGGGYPGAGQAPGGGGGQPSPAPKSN
jgi:hypothetical protein